MKGKTFPEMVLNSNADLIKGFYSSLSSEDIKWAHNNGYPFKKVGLLYEINVKAVRDAKK